MVIYKTINLINGKIYIGQDSKNNPKYMGSGKILKLAFKKYGKENFKKEILEECKSINELDKREKYWIDKFNSTDEKIGYNISYGGQIGWMSGMKHTEETKKMLSLKRKGVFVGKKNYFYGKKHSEESKKKMGRDTSNTKNGMYGKHHTEETKKRISKNLLGKKNHFYGKKHSEESKKKMSESSTHKKVIVNDKIFDSAKEASLFFNLSISCVYYRCKKKIKNWSWFN
jgi:hypothetical protein